MRQLLVVTFAILLAGCDRDADRPVDSPDVDHKKQALTRLTEEMSAEFLEGLVAKMERDYPPTGHDMWALADDILSYGDNPSNAEFERRLKKVVLKALRTRAENIFGAVLIGRDPPGTDDLKFAITNRTGRKVSVAEGVMQIRNTFGSNVESLKLKVDKRMAPGGQANCGGHWPVSAGLLDQLVAGDKRYELRFVATKIIYTDGTVEVFP